MKYLSIILTLFLCNACSQEKPTDKTKSIKWPKSILYVLNPNQNDTLCISEVTKAKKDVEIGKIVFMQDVGILINDIRYKAELEELCEQNGLVFAYNFISCDVIVGQTQGCYKEYMDKIIIDKNGIDFKEKLHQKADSLFCARIISNNKIVYYANCDERPRLPYESERKSNLISSVYIDDPNIKLKKGEDVSWPFFDINFIIEKDGTISKFNYDYFVSERNENKKFENKLFEIAVKHIQHNYPIWVTGKIKGVPVRTYNNVRIYLTKEN